MNSINTIEQLEATLNKGLPMQYTYIPKSTNTKNKKDGDSSDSAQVANRYDSKLAASIAAFDKKFSGNANSFFENATTRRDMARANPSSNLPAEYESYVKSQYTDKLKKIMNINSNSAAGTSDFVATIPAWETYKENRQKLVFSMVYHHVIPKIQAIPQCSPITYSRRGVDKVADESKVWRFELKWVDEAIRPMNILQSTNQGARHYVSSKEYQEIASMLVPNRQLNVKINKDSDMLDLFNWSVITILKGMLPFYRYSTVPLAPLRVADTRSVTVEGQVVNNAAAATMEGMRLGYRKAAKRAADARIAVGIEEIRQITLKNSNMWIDPVERGNLTEAQFKAEELKREKRLHHLAIRALPEKEIKSELSRLSGEYAELEHNVPTRPSDNVYALAEENRNFLDRLTPDIPTRPSGDLKSFNAFLEKFADRSIVKITVQYLNYNDQFNQLDEEFKRITAHIKVRSRAADQKPDEITELKSNARGARDEMEHTGVLMSKLLVNYREQYNRIKERFFRNSRLILKYTDELAAREANMKKVLDKADELATYTGVEIEDEYAESKYNENIYVRVKVANEIRRKNPGAAMVEAVRYAPQVVPTKSELIEKYVDETLNSLMPSLNALKQMLALEATLVEKVDEMLTDVKKIIPQPAAGESYAPDVEYNPEIVGIYLGVLTSRIRSIIDDLNSPVTIAVSETSTVTTVETMAELLEQLFAYHLPKITHKSQDHDDVRQLRDQIAKIYYEKDPGISDEDIALNVVTFAPTYNKLQELRSFIRNLSITDNYSAIVDIGTYVEVIDTWFRQPRIVDYENPLIKYKIGMTNVPTSAHQIHGFIRGAQARVTNSAEDFESSNPYEHLTNAFFNYGKKYFTIDRKNKGLLKNAFSSMESLLAYAGSVNVNMKESQGHKLSTAFINLSPLCDMLDINPQIVLNAIGYPEDGCVLNKYITDSSPVTNTLRDIFMCDGCKYIGGSLIHHEDRLWRICPECMSNSYRITCPNVLKRFHQPSRRVIEYFTGRQLINNPNISDYAVMVRSKTDTLSLDKFSTGYAERLAAMDNIKDFFVDFATVPLETIVSLSNSTRYIALYRTVEAGIERAHTLIAALNDKLNDMVVMEREHGIKLKKHAALMYEDGSTTGHAREGLSAKVKSRLAGKTAIINREIDRLNEDITRFIRLMAFMQSYGKIFGLMHQLFDNRPNITTETLVEIFTFAKEKIQRGHKSIEIVTRLFKEGRITQSYCSESMSAFPSKIQTLHVLLKQAKGDEFGRTDEMDKFFRLHSALAITNFPVDPSTSSTATAIASVGKQSGAIGEDNGIGIYANKQGMIYTEYLDLDNAQHLRGRPLADGDFEYLPLNTIQLNFIHKYMACEVENALNAFVRYGADMYKYDSNVYVPFKTICQSNLVPRSVDDIRQGARDADGNMVVYKDNYNLKEAMDTLVKALFRNDDTILLRFVPKHSSHIRKAAVARSGIYSYNQWFDHYAHDNIKELVADTPFMSMGENHVEIGGSLFPYKVDPNLVLKTAALSRDDMSQAVLAVNAAQRLARGM